jgi:hypothetical protein
MADARLQLIGSGDKAQIGLAANTLVRAGVGRLARVSVTTAGAVGAVYDSATIGGVGAGGGWRLRFRLAHRERHCLRAGGGTGGVGFLHLKQDQWRETTGAI